MVILSLVPFLWCSLSFGRKRMVDSNMLWRSEHSQLFPVLRPIISIYVYYCPQQDKTSLIGHLKRDYRQGIPRNTCFSKSNQSKRNMQKVWQSKTLDQWMQINTGQTRQSFSIRKCLEWGSIKTPHQICSVIPCHYEGKFLAEQLQDLLPFEKTILLRW